MEQDPRLPPVDIRGPTWIVWAYPRWRPIFPVDAERSVLVLSTIVCGYTKAQMTSYFAISPTNPNDTLYYRTVYRPSRYELLAGV